MESIKNNKTYKVGDYRVFMSYFKGVYSIYKGEGLGLNEKVREYTKRFDAVCHVEAVISEYKMKIRHAS